ncbi:hypothetical protein G6F32_013272 [Rhizopus arrhizus]|nr:hypothetical protein G6F32_013272 [Rhizopus arrhizus]
MFVSVLRGKLSDPAQQQTSDHIDAALAAQDAILNSLLDIARLESGSLPTRVQAFRLGPLLQTLAREFGIAAQSRGLVVDWVDTDAVVVSDEALLRRILQNFLSNALRYSERGRVLLADWLARQQQRGLLRDADHACTARLILAMAVAEPLRERVIGVVAEDAPVDVHLHECVALLGPVLQVP